jgi:methionyl-tRNA synthetase
MKRPKGGYFAMMTRKLCTHELSRVADILVQSMYPWQGVVDTPFGAAWAIVKPRRITQYDMHQEAETFFIASGRGLVRAGQEAQEVEEGDVIYFPPFTPHTLENLSDVDNLVFMTIYWQDRVLAAARPDRGAVPDRSNGQKKVLVLATPPTPNGDLHLGHLSGPYLGADIYTRYLRLHGIDARYVTGTDDNQSYVAMKAGQIGRASHATAVHFGDKIRTSLHAAHIQLDYYAQPTQTTNHVAMVTEFFMQLYAAGKLIDKETACLYCEICQRYLFEPYVSGRCPHCGMPAAGNSCEECGRPNDCIDLIDPVCTTCQQPPGRRRLTRLFFPLGQYESQLQEFVAEAHMTTRLRVLCDQMLAVGLPDIAISHVSDWGIPVPVAGFEGQVIWSWFEIAPLYLTAARALEARLGWSVSSENFLEQEEVDVVQFFGFDNGYQKTLLLTALYMAYSPTGRPPATFISNEFYRLDGSKFSTSRNHVVPLEELFRRTPADPVRFYLCLTRPEAEQTNFTSVDYANTVQHELVDGWQGWLHALGTKVVREFDGLAPASGIWTEAQHRFDRELGAIVTGVEAAFERETFSPQKAVRMLRELVRCARSFGLAEVHWSGVADRRAEQQTAVALELAAARMLALLSAPIMPGFAEQLWQDLGYETSIVEHGWEHTPDLVPARARINLNREYFAAPRRHT